MARRNAIIKIEIHSPFIFLSLSLRRSRARLVNVSGIFWAYARQCCKNGRFSFLEIHKAWGCCNECNSPKAIGKRIFDLLLYKILNLFCDGTITDIRTGFVIAIHLRECIALCFYGHHTAFVNAAAIAAEKGFSFHVNPPRYKSP